MKKIAISVALLGLYSGIAAQQQVIKISGTRLAYPLFNEWIIEYKKNHSNIDFVVDNTIAPDSSDIVIAAYSVQPAEISSEKQLVPVARYVQLPVANSGRKNLAQLQQKGFTQQDFATVYFASNPPGKAGSGFTVYTRQKPACAAKAFAAHFGALTSKLTGVGVPGDDKRLLDAVKLDVNGISYNNLGFIYNLQTRLVNDSIAIIPIDLNENGKIDSDEQIYTTLDDVLKFADKTNHNRLPIENVNVIVKKNIPNTTVKEFLRWVIKEGQSLNYNSGFLQLRNTQQEDQLAIIAANATGDTLDAIYGKQQ